MQDDPLQIALKFLLVLVLVAINGFFVAAEFALVKVRDTQLEPLVKKGHRRASMARRILGELNAFLSAAQLGITMASLGLGWVGEPLFTSVLAPFFESLGIQSSALRHSLAFAIGFSALTFLHITAGEQAPKAYAIARSLPAALWIAQPMRWFYLAFYPFNWALNHAAQWMLRQVGIEVSAHEERIHSEEELRLLVAGAQRQTGAAGLGRNLVLNAMDLRRRVARDVMRPRHEIVPFDTEASIAECLDIAEKTRYSRFPLCDKGDLDRTLGVIHIKDLYAMRLKARSGADLLPVARKLIYVPETARLETLLHLLLERKLHLAIIVDEYGSTMGMATLENILEELVGQIQDEFDQEQPLLVRAGQNQWQLDGALPLHELGDLVGQNLQEEGITTVSGWITHRLGGFAKPGDVLSISGYELRVEAMDGLRVAKLRLAKTDGARPA